MRGLQDLAWLWFSMSARLNREILTGQVYMLVVSTLRIKLTPLMLRLWDRLVVRAVSCKFQLQGPAPACYKGHVRWHGTARALVHLLLWVGLAWSPTLAVTTTRWMSVAGSAACNPQ